MNVYNNINMLVKCEVCPLKLERNRAVIEIKSLLRFNKLRMAGHFI